MLHWNGHQMCAIDTETTGLIAGYHEIYEVAIIPLTSNLEVRRDIIPFSVKIRPEFPERVDPKAITKTRFADVLMNGFDCEKVKDLLQEWYKKLDLPYTDFGNQKKIMPMGHNYIQFDRNFLVAWLGQEIYDELFFYIPRDTMVAVAYLNDRYAMHAERVPHQKYSLHYICNTLNIEWDSSQAHYALYDAVKAAAVYKKLLEQGLIA